MWYLILMILLGFAIFMAWEYKLGTKILIVYMKENNIELPSSEEIKEIARRIMKKSK